MASFCELSIMAPDLKEFLGEFQRGIEVCVADSGAGSWLDTPAYPPLSDDSV